MTTQTTNKRCRFCGTQENLRAGPILKHRYDDNQDECFDADCCRERMARQQLTGCPKCGHLLEP